MFYKFKLHWKKNFIYYKYKLQRLKSTNLALCLVLKILFVILLKSGDVYQFQCASCGAQYIGETSRHFNTRVNETKIPTFLNISVLLKVVGISVIFLVLDSQSCQHLFST